MSVHQHREGLFIIEGMVSLDTASHLGHAVEHYDPDVLSPHVDDGLRRQVGYGCARADRSKKHQPHASHARLILRYFSSEMAVHQKGANINVGRAGLGGEGGSIDTRRGDLKRRRHTRLVFFFKFEGGCDKQANAVGDEGTRGRGRGRG